ncbi:SO2930 family diheme c-type cytochrome [Kordiimonas laminariae]|uniref:SO2930 family diheme c-type cytochrome n=1 Tax=Kordiimonas laminariae TaxID=2917717 RepID=UPI001FF6D48A|nr:SO2930 family diheme c-type cytochrome [Kordiimonas laminariae]MCK0070159.1 hypothetical protein [Kordiimonas laminariae]
MVVAVRFFVFLSMIAAFFAEQAGAEVNDAALMKKRPAKLLSDYRLFSDVSAHTPADGVLPYGMKMPLFTDYAHKYRFVYIPEGMSATYSEHEVMEFPVGTTLIKTFAYPADFRKPDENIRRIETRLLIRQETGWNAWAYVWNEDQSDAVLKVAGKTLPVSWVDETGESRFIDYVVPNKNQCKGCHTLGREFTPIGPKARYLNFSYEYHDEKKNQITKWVETGKLSGAPTPDKAPTVPEFDDLTASLDRRARAYLDINCAHCHRSEGPASTSGLFLTYGETNKVTWGYKKTPVAAGRGSGGFSVDIEPGQPEKSILLYRVNSVDPGVMMPEVGRTTIHTEGVDLLKEWIKKLE